MQNSSFLSLKDGTQLFFKDWGTGQPIVFHHGWPLSSDAFEDQMLFLANKGYRVIAHDRRGNGRSSQAFNGHNMDQYADDVAELVAHLNLKNVIHIGHSTGGGEVARFIARQGTSNVKKAILIGAIPPLMLKTEQNPNGLPIEVFNDFRTNVLTNRAEFFKEAAIPFFGFNIDKEKKSQGLIDSFWSQGMQASIKAVYECIQVFSETDQTEDLKLMDIPTLLLYGDKDQIVPPIAASEAAAKLLPKPTVKVYVGGSHGICSTEKDRVNQDMWDFIKE